MTDILVLVKGESNKRGRRNNEGNAGVPSDTQMRSGAEFPDKSAKHPDIELGSPGLPSNQYLSRMTWFLRLPYIELPIIPARVRM
jgi:hypothetical protein